MSIERLYKVILEPHISEKATKANEQGQYVFKVLKDATKREIKKAVEFLFKVKVLRVTVCNVKGKRKIFGRVAGKRKDWKKAYIRLQEGQLIDFETHK